VYRTERAGGLCHVETEEDLPPKTVSRIANLKTVQPQTVSSTLLPTAVMDVSPAVETPFILAVGMVAGDSLEDSEIQLVDVVTKNSLPVLTDDICLFPGSEPIVRVEEAPSNARRIFTGVDVMADMESIWEVLTAFDRLQNVVPSLVKNEVSKRTTQLLSGIDFAKLSIILHRTLRHLFLRSSSALLLGERALRKWVEPRCYPA
jgi:hypothetical protein